MRVGGLVVVVPLAGALALAGGCSEEELGGSRRFGGEGAMGADASADGSGPLGPLGDVALPRLSRAEYEATLADVLREVAPKAATDIVAALQPTLATLLPDQAVAPPKEKRGGFTRLDQSVQQAYVEAPFYVAVALGKELTKSPARIGETFGACAAAGTAVDRVCAEAFVKRFGELVHRRPISNEDVAFYLTGLPATGNVTASALAELIAVMASSPQFLYHVESGQSGASDAPAAGAPGGEVAPTNLDAWELASRLSYHFTGTMPDAALREVARKGDLLKDDGYAREVERLMADPRAEPVFDLFHREWFWPLTDLPPLDARVGDPVFDAFSGANRPTAGLRERMVKEVLDAARWVVGHQGGVADLINDKHNFARDADLAALYGVPAWNGQGEPPLLPADRAGLLTRAAFLATGTANTRPIMKGVFIRSTLLCDDIPPPPNNAANTPLNLAPNMTTREIVEQVTEQKGSACVGCHQAYINPLGFASENFDALGRSRAAQQLFDGAGKVVGSKPVNTSTVPSINAGDPQVSSGIGDVTRLALASGRVESCLSRQYFRFTFRRFEGPADGPLIDELTKLLRGGAPLAQVFKAIALRPEFKQRTFR